MPYDPHWLETGSVAEALGVTTQTVRRWIRAGKLKAGRPTQAPHYSDLRPRSTGVGHFLIHVDDLADFLERVRGSRRIPPGLLKGG